MLCDLVNHRIVQRFAGFLSFFNDTVAQLFPAHIHKRCQMRKCKRLPAVLIGGHLCNDLCRHITGSEKAVRLLDHRFADDCPVLKHIFQVNQIAIMLFLGIIIHVMEMNDSLLMSADNLFRQQHTACKILADLACHIVTLRGIDHRILIGILLFYFLVQMVNQSQNPIVSRI